MYIPKADQQSVNIDLSLIDLRPDARPHSPEDIEKLAKSMSLRQLQNIILCKEGSRYELIAGVGRVLAARKLELPSLRADVYHVLAESQKLSIMFDENEDRENPPILYQANLMKAMQQEDGRPDRTQEQLASVLGKDQTTISKYLALQALSPKIWVDMNRFINLGIAHFVQLLRIKNEEDQWKVAKVAVEKDYSVSDLQRSIDKKLEIAGAKKMGRPKNRKTLGEDGFEVKIRNGNLMIRAVLPLAEEPEDFLGRLRTEILRLRTTATEAPALTSQTSTSVELRIPDALPTSAESAK